MNNENEQKNEEIPAWKLVDLICRKWAVMSGFEKDQEMYQKLKESQDLS